MSWNEISKQWPMEKSRLQGSWDKLTAEDLDAIQGDRSKLADRLCGHYGWEADEANRQIETQIGVWDQERSKNAKDLVERASEDSFPASDPPSFTPQTSVRKDQSQTADHASAAPTRKQTG